MLLGSNQWAQAFVADFNQNAKDGEKELSGGFSNWRLPTSEELDALFATGKKSDLRQYLSQNGGFYNASNCMGKQPLSEFCGYVPSVWTSTKQGDQYIVGDLVLGKTDPGPGPAHVLMVREPGPCERYYSDLTKPPAPSCE